MWCQCTVYCRGGKTVSRSTWYKHAQYRPRRTIPEFLPPKQEHRGTSYSHIQGAEIVRSSLDEHCLAKRQHNIKGESELQDGEPRQAEIMGRGGSDHAELGSAEYDEETDNAHTSFPNELESEHDLHHDRHSDSRFESDEDFPDEDATSISGSDNPERPSCTLSSPSPDPSDGGEPPVLHPAPVSTQGSVLPVQPGFVSTVGELQRSLGFTRPVQNASPDKGEIAPGVPARLRNPSPHCLEIPDSDELYSLKQFLRRTECFPLPLQTSASAYISSASSSSFSNMQHFLSRTHMMNIIATATHETLIESRNAAYLTLITKVISLEHERKGIWDAYKALVSTLSICKPANAPSASVNRLPPSPLSTHSRLDYPNVPFWLRREWDAFKRDERNRGIFGGDEQHRKQRDKSGLVKHLGYITDKNGLGINGYQAAEMRSTCRQIWATLAKKGAAPATWTQAGIEAAEFYYEHVYRAHPILRLCEGHWKAHLLAVDHYPSWYRARKDVLATPHLEKEVAKVPVHRTPLVMPAIPPPNKRKVAEAAAAVSKKQKIMHLGTDSSVIDSASCPPPSQQGLPTSLAESPMIITLIGSAHASTSSESLPLTKAIDSAHPSTPSQSPPLITRIDLSHPPASLESLPLVTLVDPTSTPSESLPLVTPTDLGHPLAPPDNLAVKDGALPLHSKASTSCPPTLPDSQPVQKTDISKCVPKIADPCESSAAPFDPHTPAAPAMQKMKFGKKCDDAIFYPSKKINSLFNLFAIDFCRNNPKSLKRTVKEAFDALEPNKREFYANKRAYNKLHRLAPQMDGSAKLEPL